MEYINVTRDDFSTMMQRVDEAKERLEAPTAAEVARISAQAATKGLKEVPESEKMEVIHATSMLSDLLEIRPNFGGTAKVVVFDGLDAEQFRKPGDPKSRGYSGIPYSAMISQKNVIRTLGFLSVEMVKTVDDWWWVSIDCQECATHPLMGYRTDWRDSVYYRCDQARGVTALLASDEFASILEEYPGNHPR
jgi:hypothetical protein